MRSTHMKRFRKFLNEAPYFEKQDSPGDTFGSTTIPPLGRAWGETYASAAHDSVHRIAYLSGGFPKKLNSLLTAVEAIDFGPGLEAGHHAPFGVVLLGHEMIRLGRLLVDAIEHFDKSMADSDGPLKLTNSAESSSGSAELSPRLSA